MGGIPDVSLAPSVRQALGAVRSQHPICADGSLLDGRLIPSASMESLLISVPSRLDWSMLTHIVGFTTAGLSQSKIVYLVFPLNDPWKRRTFSQCILSLIELSEKVLGCERLVLVLERGSPDLDSYVMDFSFIGFSLNERDPYFCNPRHILMSYVLQ